MNKRNQINKIEFENDWLVFTTDHFRAKIRVQPEGIYEHKNDPYIRMDSQIISKTSYFTNFQYRKFLKRFVLSAIKSKIKKEKLHG